MPFTSQVANWGLFSTDKSTPMESRLSRPLRLVKERRKLCEYNIPTSAVLLKVGTAVAHLKAAVVAVTGLQGLRVVVEGVDQALTVTAITTFSGSPA